MSWRDTLKRWFNFGQTKPDDPNWYTRWLPAPGLFAGIPLTMEKALQVSVVWGCIDAITKGIASSAWNVYALNGMRRERRPDDPLGYLLNTRPNPEMTAIAWREAMLYSALSWGNGYSEIVPDGANRPKELWPLDPSRVTPRRDPETWEMYYEYTNLGDGAPVRIPANRMYHVRGPSLSGLVGEGLVYHAAKTISLFVAQEQFAASYYSNNTVVGAILKYPKALDEATYLRLKNDWEEKRQGPDKAHKPLILEGGMEFQVVNANAESSQIVEARKLQVEEICRWFGVPPHKIQHLERSTYNNIEHQSIEFVRDALTPWAVRLEQEADYKLLSERGPKRTTKLDLAWLSQGDAKSKAEAYQIMRRIGVYSANDILELEGRNTIGHEGDVRIVERNMSTIDQIENPPEPVSAAPAPRESEQGDTQSGDENGSDPSPDRAPLRAALVREAVVALFASALERYVKKLQNREADLKRKKNRDEVLVLLAEEREKLRPWLLKECSNGIELTRKFAHVNGQADSLVLYAADELDNGGAPRDAASKLVTKLLEGEVT